EESPRPNRARAPAPQRPEAARTHAGRAEGGGMIGFEFYILAVAAIITAFVAGRRTKRSCEVVVEPFLSDRAAPLRVRSVDAATCNEASEVLIRIVDALDAREALDGAPVHE